MYLLQLRIYRNSLGFDTCRDLEKTEAEETGPAGRHSMEEGVGVATGRRAAIKPKDYAGGVVWAKLAKYPW